MNHVKLIEKWMDAEATSFTEKTNPSTGKREYILEATIVPFNKVSRNGVLYNKGSIERTHKMLEGKPLMFNHVTDGANVMPRGEWVETWIENDCMKGKAKVYDTAYNKDLIEYLTNASSPRVSLQVTGGAEQKKTDDGKYFKEADIEDWLEASIVNVPGFDLAKSSFAVAMAEAFNNNEKDKEALTVDKKYLKIIVDHDLDFVKMGGKLMVDIDEADKLKSLKIPYDESKEMKLKEDDLEQGDFPLDEFKKGLAVEMEEHDSISPIDAARLVLDHMEEDEYYYSNDSNGDEDQSDDIIEEDFYHALTQKREDTLKN